MYEKTLTLHVTTLEAFTLKRAMSAFYDDALSGDRWNMARIGSQINIKLPMPQYEKSAPTQGRLFP